MIPLGEAAMLKFLQRFSSQVIGVLNGLDRIRFRGAKRLLASVGGMIHYCRLQKMLNKDFTPFALALTAQFKEGIQQHAESNRQPILEVPHGPPCKYDYS